MQPRSETSSSSPVMETAGTFQAQSHGKVLGSLQHAIADSLVARALVDAPVANTVSHLVPLAAVLGALNLEGLPYNGVYWSGTRR